MKSKHFIYLLLLFLSGGGGTEVVQSYVQGIPQFVPTFFKIKKQKILRNNLDEIILNLKELFTKPFTARQ